MIQSAICVGVFIQKDDKFLLVEENNGKYNFPMGNLEDNESILQGAKREALEETGFKVDILSLRNILHIKRGDFHLTKFLFHADIKSQEQEDLHETNSIKWVTKDEFQTLYANNLLRSEDMIQLLNYSSQVDYYNQSA